MDEEIFHTQALEGIKIQRERKYLIQDKNTADTLINNLPQKLLLSLNDPSIDTTTIDFLKELFLEPGKDALETSIDAFKQESGDIVIHKVRPVYSFDTEDNHLQENNFTFNLRKRESDWIATIKLRPQSQVKKGIQKGIFERIEVNCIVGNEIIENSREKDKININKTIEQVPKLQETCNKQFSKIIRGKPFIATNAFIVESNRVIYPLSNGGWIQLSVDTIKIEGAMKNFHELEIELRFGPQNTWLDTILIRVFDHICKAVTEIIKNQLKSKLDEKSFKHLFSEITHLSKIEKVRNITSPSVIVQSLDSEDFNLAMLTDAILATFRSETVVDMLPMLFCPYWISIPQIYNDVKPDKPSGPHEKRKTKLSLEEVQIYREALMESFLGYFDQVLNNAANKPGAFIPQNYFSKTFIYKVSPNIYFALFLFPYEEYEQVKYLVRGNEILNKLFKQVTKDLYDSDIYEKVEVDCSLIVKELHISETTRIIVDNLSYFSVEDIDDIDGILVNLNLRIQQGEKDLLKLVKGRKFLKHRGERKPVVIISAENRENQQALYTPFREHERPPIYLKKFSEHE